MKRPDDFELFHQNRKRRPLGEVRPDSNQENRPRKQSEKIPGQSTKKSADTSVKLRAKDVSSIRSIKSSSRSAFSLKDSARYSSSLKKSIGFEDFGIAQYRGKENKGTSKIQPSKKQKIPIWHDLVPPDLKEDAKSYISPVEPKKSVGNEEIKMSTSTWPSSPTSNNGDRYKLLNSLVDYNPTVEKSNKVIRSFCDSMKLSSTLAKRLKAGKVRSEKTNTVIIDKISKFGSFLEAVTTSDGEELLLVNVDGYDLAAGSKVHLTSPIALDSGTQIRVYSKWKVVSEEEN